MWCRMAIGCFPDLAVCSSLWQSLWECPLLNPCTLTTFPLASPPSMAMAMPCTATNAGAARYAQLSRDSSLEGTEDQVLETFDETLSDLDTVGRRQQAARARGQVYALYNFVISAAVRNCRIRRQVAGWIRRQVAR